MFNLIKEKMAITVQLRIEKHGDENVNAYDARLQGNFPNAVLLKLHPELRDTFYKPAQQGDFEQDFYPERRFPQIDTVAWGLEIPRTLLRLHDASDPCDDLVLGGGTTDKFVLEMLAGGTVKMSFRVKLGELDEDDVAKLLRANGQTIPISLECAAEEEKPDNFEQVDLITQEPHSAARAEAESLFSAPPTTMTLDDVVDASFDPDFREVRDDESKTSNVEPITAARRGRPRKAASGSVE